MRRRYTVDNSGVANPERLKRIPQNLNVTPKEAIFITKKIMDKFPNAPEREMQRKVNACVNHIAVQRARGRGDDWQSRMILRGAFPDFKEVQHENNEHPVLILDFSKIESMMAK